MSAGLAQAGLENVVVAETRKSRVFGREGRLIYHGYRIEDLAEHASFEEVVYLLWNNALPSGGQLESLKAALAATRELPEPVMEILRRLPSETPPMTALRTGVSALGAFDEDAEGAPEDDAGRRRVMTALVSRVPSLIAAWEQIRGGREPVAPRPDLGHSANLLYQLNGTEAGPAAVRAIDAYLVLLADHGFNASTFSARVTAATMSDPYSAVTSAIGTLKGPLHGGANQRVMEMLVEIGEPAKARAWVLDKIHKRERIMGIGHRVYKTLDPRAAILRRMSEAQALESDDRRLHDIAMEVADTAVGYFQENRPDLSLYPNVDFYSAAVLAGAGIPADQFTPLFAASRIAGWTAHLMEQYTENRLIRPRADYVGPLSNEWVPIEQR